jgi:hypothetical protein
MPAWPNTVADDEPPLRTSGSCQPDIRTRRLRLTFTSGGGRIPLSLAVNHPTHIQVRRDSWLLAVAFLIAFCCLGFFIARFAPIFRGVESELPAADRLIIAYGPIAFPLLGGIAALSFVLSDHFFRRQWTQWALIALYVPIILWAFSSLVAPKFIGGASSQANNRPATSLARPIRLQSVELRRGVVDPSRSAKICSNTNY